MSVTDCITALIAIYGALLSTIIYRNTHKKKLILNLTSPLASSSPKKLLLLNIANDSYHELYIDRPLLLDPNSHYFIPSFEREVGFPYKIDRGNSLTIMIDYQHVEVFLINQGYSGKVSIRAYVVEQTGKKFISIPFIIELGEEA